MNRCLALAAWSLAACLAMSAAHAQATGTAAPPTASTAVTGSVTIAFERTSLQTLADGTHITRTTHERFYRDSQGRTRSDYELNSPAGQPEVSRTNVSVFDPVAGQMLSWMSGAGIPQMYTVTKMGRTTPLPNGLPATQSFDADPGLRSAPPVPPAEVSAGTGMMRPTVTRQNLGTQDVQGAPCQAMRTTTVYPTGMLGNDRPITVVREICTSREFRRTLQERTDDPRTGVRTLAVTSLSRADPDAALFAAPPGYTERLLTVGSK